MPDPVVRFITSTRNGEYYKVDEAADVIHLTRGRFPLVCLKCRQNECHHAGALAAHLAAHGTPVPFPMPKE